MNCTKYLQVPKQDGQRTNKGTAGILYGSINEFLIFGGGANFPHEDLVKGGTKVNHKDIYLYHNDTLLDRISLHKAIAYGLSVCDDKFVYYIDDEIIRIEVVDNKLCYNILTKLDEKVENAAGFIKDNHVYYLNSNTKEFKEINLDTFEITKLTPFIGDPRSQASFGLVSNKFVIASGSCDNKALTDAYAYDISTDNWQKLPDMINNTSLLGASCTKISDSTLLFVGGFNKEVFDDACYNLSTLTGDEKNTYRLHYLSRDIEEYNWNRHAITFDISDNTWNMLDNLGIATCESGLVKIGKSIFLIMGEVKPGVRTSYIYKIKGF